ncbi:hypothetical protein KFK09_015477 [Dendrobium nobile]|uniref:Uncharacterized protein n=1 Tax=Dendrobium nobile TaxID=94219 RepID=A0A8T3B6A5_DENNO|nr:hypothetical protein KFK09_015477 [Dendrobium nobile]
MLSAYRFIYQSRKLYNCWGMLQHICCASASVIARKAPSCYIPPYGRTGQPSFSKLFGRFSTALPFQWNKSRGELLAMMNRGLICQNYKIILYLGKSYLTSSNQLAMSLKG